MAHVVLTEGKDPKTYLRQAHKAKLEEMLVVTYYG
jgi:hypothetical protein